MAHIMSASTIARQQSSCDARMVSTCIAALLSFNLSALYYLVAPSFPLTLASSDVTKRHKQRLDDGIVTAYYAAMHTTLPLCTPTASPQAALPL